MIIAPWHKWFAWHPVRTNYHGWKWLRKVYRRQRWTPFWAFGVNRYWEYNMRAGNYSEKPPTVGPKGTAGDSGASAK